MGDIIQGSGSGGDTVWIVDMGHEPTHWKDAGGISLLGGPADDGEKNAEGNRRGLEAPPYGCGDGGGRTGGGG